MNGALSRRFQTAFTLVELMVVLFIAGLLAITAIPAFQQIQKGNALKTGIRQVSSAINLARGYAITRRQNTRFVVIGDAPDNASRLRSNEEFRQHAEKVLCAYAVCTVSTTGELIEYVRPWEYLPEGVVFDVSHAASTFQTSWEKMRFPDSSASASDTDKLWLNYLEFKPTGAAKESRTVVLTRGSVLAARDDDGKPTGRYDYRVTDTNVVWKAVVNNITGRVRVEEVVK